MSQAKRLMEHHESQRQAAIDICLAAKVLRACEYHGDILLEGDREEEYAYRVGNKRFTGGELEGTFKTRQEMTDAIKAAIENEPCMSCPRCDKMLAD
jgi:hypothetical protein